MKTDWRPVDFDGLVVESATGDRLLALPTAVLEILRHAAVIRYRRGDSFYSLRVDTFPQAPEQQPAAPSPAPPPLVEGDALDPANIPLRVRRGGSWATIYVTRTQYEKYEREGRLADTPEGNDQ